MKNPWVVIGVITVVLFGGAFLYSSNVNERNNQGVEIQLQSKGNPEASVVLEEYSDFQCPACAAFFPIVQEMLAEYGDQVNFIYKHYPLPIHPYAAQAAVAAEAAGQQGKFFEFHDLLFENQQQWSNSPAPTAMFRQYAEEIGLDMETFGHHMNSSLLKNHVRDQVAEGRALQVTGTPTFFLNGERMVIQTYEDFIVQIAEAVNPSVNFGDDATIEEGGVEFAI